MRRTKMSNILEKVKAWLEEEIEYNEPILSGDEELSDETFDIHEGRSELAECLLEQIKKWENADE